MIKKLTAFIFLLGLLQTDYAQQIAKESILIFASFRDNGQDGLHLAYSKDGYKWTALKGDSSFLTPTVSKDKLMRDPCIIKGADGLFHMVWTVSWKDHGIGYASSKDLVHWSAQEFIPVMEQEATALNCWAPEIIYDAQNKLYMIYWSTTIPGRFAAGDTSGDEKYNHRLYYVTTNDFKKYSPAKLLYDQGFNIIDATIQKAGKKYCMFLKDETLKPVPQKNIRVAWSDHLTYGFGKPSAPITGKYWAEGPTAIQLGKKWIVYFDKYTEGKYGAVESTDLINWTDISDAVSFPAGTRHGTVVRIAAAQFQQFFKD
jgi:sucrose-6-phosphate hydrolase SacC (GH32 family)